jgi:hypothetical protein
MKASLEGPFLRPIGAIGLAERVMFAGQDGTG